MSRGIHFPKRRTVLTLALGTALLSGPVAAQAPQVLSVLGRAEVFDGNVWRALSGTPTLSSGARTGTGRLILSNGEGRVVVGSSSRLREYQGEVDFQEGQFYVEAPSGVFVLGRHAAMERAGRFRVDLASDGSTRRLAVLSGVLRVSNGPKMLTVNAGEQLSLKNDQISPFKETDPWYAAQFTGAGAATVEALRGTVQIKQAGSSSVTLAKISNVLEAGQTITTAANSWVEVGFTGGGYLRLGELSELSVVAIDKTSRGREVTLQLIRGSAWNVVEKGRGGYRITTPVLSTAVRGTTFRIDANGTLKVFEGQVVLPSQGDLPVSAGQQKGPGAEIQPLQLDEFDRMNQALDAERARPMTLSISGWERFSRGLNFDVQALSNTVISAELRSKDGQRYPLQPLAAQEDLFHIEQDVPEGEYLLQVQAVRYGKTLHWAGPVLIDHTPPTFRDLRVVHHGRVAELSGEVSDNSGRPVRLELMGTEFSQHVSGALRLILPNTLPTGGQVTLTDAAGNQTNVPLP